MRPNPVVQGIGEIQLAEDASLVVLGANGSGKSTLSTQISGSTGGRSRIPATRDIQFAQTPSLVREDSIKNEVNSSWNQATGNRVIFQSDNHLLLNRLYASDHEENNLFAERCKKNGGAIEGDLPNESLLAKTKRIWDRLFPLREIHWGTYEPKIVNRLAIHGQAAADVSFGQMSDGERCALYLIGKVLMAPTGHALVADEPEVHLHHDLAVRLWDALEAERKDLRFVYITHNLDFARSRYNASYIICRPQVKPLLIQDLDFEEHEVFSEVASVLTSSPKITQVVFCEGNDKTSIDFSFWAPLLQDEKTVVKPVGSCEDVQRCVGVFTRMSIERGFGAEIRAIGICDRDHDPIEKHNFFAKKSIYVTPVHECEGIFLLPELFNLVLENQGFESAEIQKRSMAAFESAKKAVSRVTHRYAMERCVRLARWTLGTAIDDSGSYTDKRSAEELWNEKVQQVVRKGSEVTIESETFRLESTLNNIKDFLRIYPSKAVISSFALEAGLKDFKTMIVLICNAIKAFRSGNQKALHYGLGQKIIDALEQNSIPTNFTKLVQTISNEP